MRSINKHTNALAAGILALGLMTSIASAEEVKFHVMLDGEQQSPTLNIPGKGMADVMFDTDTKELSWTIEYSDLSGPPVMGHFHGPAAKGENADVAVPFKGDLASPIKGSAKLTDAQAADLMAGKYYINIHTAAHKSGEIRGQVDKGM